MQIRGSENYEMQFSRKETGLIKNNGNAKFGKEMILSCIEMMRSLGVQV